VSYKVGGGKEGEVSSGSTWQVLDTVYDTDGAQVTVNFATSTSASGGQDEMSVEEAKVRGPLAVRTINRCVNEADFEYVGTTVAGLARAALMTSNHDSTIQEDYARLYVVAYGTAYSDSGYYPPATPTSSQLAAVAALIAEDGAYPALMGVNVGVYAAVFQDIDLKVKIFKEANYTATQVKANITQELQKYFAVADDEKAPLYNANFGYKLKGADGESDYKTSWSKVLNIINDTTGVREISSVDDNLLLNEVRASYLLDALEFSRLGALIVYDMDQGGIEI
jgi:hypothetical protein